MAKLTEKQQRFVEEYLVDLNATQAAIRAGYSAKTASSQAERLLRNVEVQFAITAARAEQSKRTQITADNVLKRYWSIATADVNELMQYRRTNCRQCWGIDHKYQWRDETEYQTALAKQQKRDAFGMLPPPLDNSGGFGFDGLRPPHPDCTNCDGEGIGRMHVTDTRKLSGDARILYAGVKMTKEGLEIKIHDQKAALDQVAKHLGMFIEQKEITLKNEIEEATDEQLDAIIADLSG